MNWLFSRSPSFFGIFVECVSTYLWCWEWPHCCSVCLQCCWRRIGRLLYPPASHLSPAECPLAAECICTTEGANIPVKRCVISQSRPAWLHCAAGLSPVVRGVEQHAVLLPGDVGLRNSVDLTLEASDATLLHWHGRWVGVELWKSWETNQPLTFVAR